jgi:hypothetical protein
MLDMGREGIKRKDRRDREEKTEGAVAFPGNILRPLHFQLTSNKKIK